MIFSLIDATKQFIQKLVHNIFNNDALEYAQTSNALF